MLTLSLGEEQNASQLFDQLAQPLMSVARNVSSPTPETQVRAAPAA